MVTTISSPAVECLLRASGQVLCCLLSYTGSLIKA